MKLLIGAFLVFLGLWNPDCAIESGWEGIRVFKSKRADVERVFGKPAEDNGEAIYRTSEAVVRVLYSNATCKKTSFGKGDFNVPPDTALEYDVFLKKAIPLANLKWSKKDYERIEDSHILGLVHYENLRIGLRFTTDVGEDKTESVGTLKFGRTVEQNNHFLCEKLDRN